MTRAERGGQRGRAIAGLGAAVLLAGACGGAASGSDTVEAGRDRGGPPPAAEAEPAPPPTPPAPEDVPDAAPDVPDAGDQVVELNTRATVGGPAASRTTTASSRRRAVTGLSELDRERVRSLAAEMTAEARLSVDALRSELRSLRDARLAALKAEVEAMAADQAALEDLIRKRHATVAARRPSGRRMGSAPQARQERSPFASPKPTTGEGVSTEGYAWPLAGYVTSEYGQRWGKLHAGIDIAVPMGTPILAAKAGEVLYTGRYGGYGNLVAVDHGDGAVTLYAHQSRIAVSEGQELNQGDVIGYVGSTGNSTGPHLHFEVRRDGRAVNPRGFLP